MNESKQPEPIERPVVGYDLGAGESFSVYRCVCGWETSNVEQLAGHLKAHGAIAVTVEPIRRATARRR